MNITLEQLSTAFTARYSPYLLKGFSFLERKPEDVLIDENHPELYAIAHSVDLKKRRPIYWCKTCRSRDISQFN